MNRRNFLHIALASVAYAAAYKLIPGGVLGPATITESVDPWVQKVRTRFYVDPTNGNDINDGLSVRSGRRTISSFTQQELQNGVEIRVLSSCSGQLNLHNL